MKPASHKKISNSVNILIAIILGVLWALFWAVDATVGYVLFGGASFFLVLYFYNSKLQQEPKQPSTDRTKQPKATPTTSKPNQVLSLVGYGIIGLIALAFLYNVINPPDDNNTEEQAVFEQNSFVTKGNNSYNISMYDSAYYYYKQAIAQTPDLADAWLGLGNVCYNREQKDSALWYYQQTIKIDPTNSKGRYNVAWWYYSDKQYNKAISLVNSLYADDVENPDAMQLLGDSYYAKVSYDTAIIWYQKTYDTGIRSQWLCHVMAYLYDTKNDSDRAIALYKEALEYDATVIDVYNRLGELLPGADGEQYRVEAARLKIEKGN